MTRHWCTSCEEVHGCHCKFVQCFRCQQFDCPSVHQLRCPGEQLKLFEYGDSG